MLLLFLGGLYLTVINLYIDDRAKKNLIMLTAKQERFVQELAKGKSQREAYKAAYNAENMKITTIDKKASLLFKQGELRGRYDEIMSEIKENTTRDAESVRRFIIEQLEKIASGEICDETTEYDAKGNVIKRKKTVKAADMKDAMAKLGEYYGVQTEVKQEIVVQIKGAEGYDC